MTMKRLLPALLILVAFSAVGAAGQHSHRDNGPGMIRADSPLYGLEVAMGNAAVSIGLAKAGGAP
jgi:hypothetical protein